MRVTLKEILDELKKFVGEHYQLLEYGFGPIDNISTKNTKYPLLWITPMTSNVYGNSFQLGLDMYVLDLEKQDFSNLEDIMSETLLIGNDIITRYFETAEIEGEYDLWTIMENDVIIEAYEYRFDDVLAGWRFQFVIEIENRLNDCEVPLKP